MGNEYFIIPKDGQIEAMKEKVAEIVKNKCSVDSFSSTTKLALEVQREPLMQ